jgi:hypothetical protein
MLALLSLYARNVADLSLSLTGNIYRRMPFGYAN